MRTRLWRLGSARGLARRASLLVAAAAAIVLLVGPAQAAISTKYYKVTFTPTAFASGQAGVPVSISLLNCSSASCAVGSTQTLGSANVAIPNAFTVASPTLGAVQEVSVGTKKWRVTLAAGTEPGYSRVLEFRAVGSKDALAAGQSVAAAVTLDAPCGGGPYPTKSYAKQANSFSGPPGNDFQRVGDDPVLTVAPASIASVAFEGQPSDTRRSEAIDPAVSVRVKDSCGNGVSGASVALDPQDDPSGGTATLAGDTATTDAAGLATFANLTVDTNGIGYSLVATSGTVSSLESDSFDVVDVLCTGTTFPCEFNDPQNHTSVSINGAGALKNGPLPGDLGIIVSESGIPLGDANCGDGATSVGRVVTILPDEGVATPESVLLEVTFRYGSHVVPGSGGVPHIRFCAKDPDTPWYEVFNCANPVVPKCISKRNAAPGADVLITALMTWKDPDWGGFN